MFLHHQTRSQAVLHVTDMLYCKSLKHRQLWNSVANVTILAESGNFPTLSSHFFIFQSDLCPI